MVELTTWAGGAFRRTLHVLGLGLALAIATFATEHAIAAVTCKSGAAAANEGDLSRAHFEWRRLAKDASHKEWLRATIDCLRITNVVREGIGFGRQLAGMGRDIQREVTTDVKERGVGGFLGNVMSRMNGTNK